MPRERRASQTTPAVVAAATRVRVGERGRVTGYGTRPEWQRLAWGFYDAIPEIQFGIRFQGVSLSKLRLFVAVTDPENPDADPIPVTDEKSGIPAEIAARAEAELGRLRTDVGGQAEILRCLTENLGVAGEAFIVGWAARPARVVDGRTLPEMPETWEIRSVDEVTRTGDKFLVGEPNDQRELVLEPPDGAGPDYPVDTIWRVFLRHPRHWNRAISQVSALLTDCEALVLLSRQIVAEAKSRQSPGLLLVPNEISFGSPDGEPVDGDDADKDPFQEELLRALTEPIEDPSSAASVMPTIVRADSQYLSPDVFRVLSLARDASETLDRRIDGRVERVARGLNLPVEVVKGHQQTTYANAAQIDKDTWDDHLEWLADLLVDTLTAAHLVPQMESAAIAPEHADRMFVWYDAGRLLAKPDPSANADQAHDRRVISDEAYRRHKGFDDADAPDADELLRRAGLGRGILTADLTLALLKLLGVPIDVQPIPTPMAQPVGPDGELLPTPDPQAGSDTTTAAALLLGAGLGARAIETSAVTAAGRRRPSSTLADLGPALSGIDRSLRDRLLVAADASLDRAVERAGNRLRSRQPRGVQASLPTGLDPRRVGYTLGRLDPALVASIDPADLLGPESFASLREQFLSWGARSQAEALDLVNRYTSGLSTAERSALQVRQAENLDEAWAILEQRLTDLGHLRVTDPTAGLVDVGEMLDGLNVPAGTLREALARAGGTVGAEIGPAGSVWVRVGDGVRPVGGIATGPDVLDTLQGLGVAAEQYQWVYGPASRSRPFEPHVELDGVLFDNFDDDVLAVSGSFPETGYYLPGDHAGCQCDFTSVFTERA